MPVLSSFVSIVVRVIHFHFTLPFCVKCLLLLLQIFALQTNCKCVTKDMDYLSQRMLHFDDGITFIKFIQQNIRKQRINFTYFFLVEAERNSVAMGFWDMIIFECLKLFEMLFVNVVFVIVNDDDCQIGQPDISVLMWSLFEYWENSQLENKMNILAHFLTLKIAFTIKIYCLAYNASSRFSNWLFFGQIVRYPTQWKITNPKHSVNLWFCTFVVNTTTK